MQAERVAICSERLMSKGVSSSWFVPLESEQSADDVLEAFAKFLLNGSRVQEYPIIQDCFTTLLNSSDECMFVFMRRGVPYAVGILRSDKPLFSEREQALVNQIGENAWNVPLWTWKESSPRLCESMEMQLPPGMHGPHFGVWCYR
jgi:hypothetical protein